MHKAPTITLFAAATLVLAAALVSCSHQAAPAHLPDGPYFSGDGVATQRLLNQLERLEPARIAVAAERARSSLADCTAVRSRPSEFNLELLLAGLECDGDSELPGGIAALRKHADLVFSAPHPSGGHFLAHARIAADGGVNGRLQLPIADSPGPWSFLVPDSSDPAPALLTGHNALLHVRTRTAGKLNVAELVPANSQADQLFGLRNALFSGALLDGRLELALYPPHAGQVIPPTALALGVSLLPAAKKAMSAYVAYLESSWAVHRSVLRIGRWQGLCLNDLNSAPDLAPCYIATEDALILGWNAASLEMALADSSAGTASRHSSRPGGSLLLSLDQLPAVDAVLAKSWQGAPSTPTGGYPWTSLVARSKATSKGVEFEIDLQAAPAQGGTGGRQ